MQFYKGKIYLAASNHLHVNLYSGVAFQESSKAVPDDPWLNPTLGFVGIWNITDNGDVPPQAMIRGPFSGLLHPVGSGPEPRARGIYVSDSVRNGILSFLVPDLLESKDQNSSSDHRSSTCKAETCEAGLREAEALGELKKIDGPDWDVEIGAVTELGHHRGEQSHALLFDHIKGYPDGYRVLSNTFNTTKRLAMTLHMDTNYTRLQFVKDIKKHITDLEYLKPDVVKGRTGDGERDRRKDIDMFKFPSPKWHELDGGRYIGTGSVDITVDPDEGWVNLGTYRVMVHDRNTLGFFISPENKAASCARNILRVANPASWRFLLATIRCYIRRRHGSALRRLGI